MKNELMMDLIAMQKKLDERIAHEFALEPGDQKVWQKKVIAFFVELGEFINEERSFKYWSRKKTNNREAVLEEYIDGLHFILSLGIDLKYDFQDHQPFVEEGDLYETYLNLIADLGVFIKKKSVWEFRKVYSTFLRIAEILGFSDEEVIAMYHKKNEKNHNRQDNQY